MKGGMYQNVVFMIIAPSVCFIVRLSANNCYENGFLFSYK